MLKILTLLLALASAGLAQVTDLAVTSRTSSSVSFTWNTSSTVKNDFVKYSQGASCSLSNSTSSSSPCNLTHSATVTGLSIGTAYCFRVGGTTCGNLTTDQGAQLIVFTLAGTPTITPTLTATPTASPTPVPTATRTPFVASAVTYQATPAPWSTPPASVHDALNRLAAAVQALQATTPIP